MRITQLLEYLRYLTRLKNDSRKRNETLFMLLGGLHAERVKQTKEVKSFTDVEFSVFSQFGDDGIIQYLIQALKVVKKTFIEFGVGDYTESNTRFLLLHDNWSGLVMDCSGDAVKKIQKDDLYWRHDLTAVSAFITAENINQLISTHGFGGEIGLLHVDVDGNDYWIWKAIHVVDPIVVIVEYNSVFGIDRPVTIPYTEDFYRTKSHHSNLYWGSSLLALCRLAEEKGYAFIGCNSAGNNAYFVRQDALNNLHAKTPTEGYVVSKYRESRDQNGKLTYVSGDKRIDCIKGMPVFNVDTNTIEAL